MRKLLRKYNLQEIQRLFLFSVFAVTTAFIMVQPAALFGSKVNSFSDTDNILTIYYNLMYLVGSLCAIFGILKREYMAEAAGTILVAGALTINALALIVFSGAVASMYVGVWLLLAGFMCWRIIDIFLATHRVNKKRKGK